MKRYSKPLVMLAILLIITILASYWKQIFLIPAQRLAVLEVLKDPDTAKFKNEKSRGEYVCGEVNSKNGMGAYTGYSRFISSKRGYAMDGDSTSTLFPERSSSASLHEQADEAIKSLDLYTATLKHENDERRAGRTPTKAELDRYAFSLLWEKYCQSK